MYVRNGDDFAGDKWFTNGGTVRVAHCALTFRVGHIGPVRWSGEYGGTCSLTVHYEPQQRLSVSGDLSLPTVPALYCVVWNTVVSWFVQGLISTGNIVMCADKRLSSAGGWTPLYENGVVWGMCALTIHSTGYWLAYWNTPSGDKYFSQQSRGARLSAGGADDTKAYSLLTARSAVPQYVIAYKQNPGNIWYGNDNFDLHAYRTDMLRLSEYIV